MATHPHRNHPSSSVIDQANADHLLQAALDAGMSDLRELSNFMAQMQVETAGFKKTQESLAYSGDRLETVLSDKFGTIRNSLTSEQVHAAARDGEKTTAEALYGGKYGLKQLGNKIGTDDCYTFRGRGFTQLTGRWNYEHMGKVLGLDLVNKPDLAAEPANAAKIATQYWKERVVARGAELDVTNATKVINGGHAALQERKDAATHWQGELSRGYKPGQPATPPVGSALGAAADPWKAAFDAVAKQNPNALLDDVAKSVVPLSITDPDHAGNDLFKQARAGMQAIDTQYGRTSDRRTDQAAALVAATAYQAGMTRIDHIELSGPSGDKIIAAQGKLGTAQSKVIDVPTMQALNTPLEQSTQAVNTAQQSQQAIQQQANLLTQQRAEPAMSR